MTVEIFVPGVGQHDNIGDIILRRQLIDWVRPLGRLHVYIGHAPDGYAGGLRLDPSDIVYESFGTWYLAGLKSALLGRARYVFKPGEIQLTLIGMKEHVGMLPLLALLRLRGGRSVRVGVGARDFAPLPRLLMMPSIALSSFTAWRDQRTTDYLRRGVTMPDLAFGEGEADLADAPAERNTVVVSMRSDRPYPTTAWLDAVRQFADERGYTVTAVTQVLRDSERSQKLARDLGGELVDWDGSGHAEQEERLRQVYARCALAVSDRLHVLVSAYTEGAVPVAPLADRSDKIQRHFDQARVANVAFPSAKLSASEIGAKFAAVMERRDEILAELPATRARLARIRDLTIAALAIPGKRAAGASRG